MSDRVSVEEAIVTLHRRWCPASLCNGYAECHVEIANLRAAIEREKAQAVAGAALAIAQTVRELAFSPTEWNPEGTPQSIEAACLLRAAADADKEGGDE